MIAPRSTIWKFPFPVADAFTLEMPTGRTIIAVDVQHGQPCMWALVDPAGPWHRYGFAVRGTGHDATGVGPHIGSFQMYGGDLVFHLFHSEAAE